MKGGGGMSVKPNHHLNLGQIGQQQNLTTQGQFQGGQAFSNYPDQNHFSFKNIETPRDEGFFGTEGFGGLGGEAIDVNFISHGLDKLTCSL